MNKKYVVVLFDGMADYPNAEGKTPMSEADKPTVDFLASHGEVGLCRTVPAGMKPGSDVANLSVMGYDPAEYYTGRSPLEALSMGIKMKPRGRELPLQYRYAFGRRTVRKQDDDRLLGGRDHYARGSRTRDFSRKKSFSPRRTRTLPGGKLPSLSYPPQRRYGYGVYASARYFRP